MPWSLASRAGHTWIVRPNTKCGASRSNGNGSTSSGYSPFSVHAGSHSVGGYFNNHRTWSQFGDLGAGFQEANALDSEASIASDSRSARTRHPRRERPPPTRSTFRDLTPPRRVSQGTEGRPRPTRHRRRPGRCLAGDSLRGIAHAANRDLAAPTAATSSRASPHRHAASTAPHPPRARDTDRRSRIRRAQCGCA